MADNKQESLLHDTLNDYRMNILFYYISRT